MISSIVSSLADFENGENTVIVLFKLFEGYTAKIFPVS